MSVDAMRPPQLGQAFPGRKQPPTPLEGLPQLCCPSIVSTPLSTTYAPCDAPKPPLKCLNSSSCTRAPLGFPRSVTSQKSAVSCLSLGAHLRRTVQPLQRLVSEHATSEICCDPLASLLPRRESGWNHRCKSPAEGMAQDGAFPACNWLREPRRGEVIKRWFQALTRRP